MSSLFAISDLHVGYAENRPFVDDLQPSSNGDWLIVAGDVGERFDEVVSTLAALRARFEQVIWVPGNHELWTLSSDPVSARGVARYERLVESLRQVGVTTPEDEYLIWPGAECPIAVVPLFLLYDYSFRRPGVTHKAQALAVAEQAGVMATDEALLHPDPYPSREAWCTERIATTKKRLDALPSDLRTVLVNHFPIVRAPTDVLWYPDFALWCGTDRTHDWPRRYRAEAVVYGHLHIPRLMVIDGVPHHEVSLGYPEERAGPDALPRGVVRILGDEPDCR